MADLSVKSNICTAGTSNLANDEQREVSAIGETIFRPCPLVQNFPSLEEVDTKYKEIILTLPKEQGLLTSTLRKYRGIWCYDRVLPGILAMEEAFKPWSSDVIVASYPKSGTTWLKALAFTIVHRNKFVFSSHPLLKLNPHDCVPFMEFWYTMHDDQYFETLPSPRVLGTHMPYSLLPESIKTSKCRIIYICRDPKDVFVSLWHMIKKVYLLENQISSNEIFELFCKGQMPYGLFWNHVLEYYTESLNTPNKILLLKYEEMMNDPVDGVMRIADFVGCPFSEEEVKLGAVKEIVKFCSFNKLKDLDVNKNERNDFYFRKAVVGDWHNYMTVEMAAKLDDIVKEKFAHCAFTYGACM